jgi:hypothetical protein
MGVNLPTVGEAHARRQAGTATVLDNFVYDYEPADLIATRHFRRDLVKVIRWTIEATKRGELE